MVLGRGVAPGWHPAGVSGIQAEIGVRAGEFPRPRAREGGDVMLCGSGAGTHAVLQGKALPLPLLALLADAMPH